MNIYLKHPVHGTKVAVLEAEAAADKLNGWEEFDPTPTVEESDADVTDKPRRGRPPKSDADA